MKERKPKKQSDGPEKQPEEQTGRKDCVRRVTVTGRPTKEGLRNAYLVLARHCAKVRLEAERLAAERLAAIAGGDTEATEEPQADEAAAPDPGDTP